MKPIHQNLGPERLSDTLTNQAAGRPRPVHGKRFENLGLIPLAIKVSAQDTDGALLVFEHRKMGKSGPPRHMHFEQDEWFHVIQGEFVFEIVEEKYRLHPGDSLLAPRLIPHA